MWISMSENGDKLTSVRFCRVKDTDRWMEQRVVLLIIFEYFPKKAFAKAVW